MKKQIINVVPATKIPPDRNQVFSYLAPKNIKFTIGQEVLIPFAGRKLRAVVLEIKKENKDMGVNNKKLKSILTLVDRAPVLSKEQIKLAEWISKYYCTSLGLVIKTMLFPRVNMRIKEYQNNLPKKENKYPFPKLTKKQQDVIKKINKQDKNKIFLLHGVTGSGKTEIYMKMIQDNIKNNRHTIILVPEISLTPQTIQRFAARFGNDKIAVLHSRLSAGEKYIQWQKIRNNKAKIIIGPRSAIFAPVNNLGLIIVDEEHDVSYKQYDQNPRYHARKVAIGLAKLFSAKIILGSATPSIESYYKAKRGNYQLLELPERYSPNIKLPDVKIIDMREELKKKNFSIFSEALRKSLKNILKNNRQALLFINRRGSSSFVMCRDCGYTIECPNCSVSLTCHIKDNIGSKKLICHHCNYITDSPVLCPKCKSQYIKYFGIGTQKVGKELNLLFPRARVIRVDSDTMNTKFAHEKAYNDFASGKYDVIIGTQMITKGWDLSNIDLVGIISSDVLFNFPDFRCNERAFQMITQVAGRTGRGKNKGKVILQCYNPDNFVIKSASEHDYKLFYNQEIKERAELNYPPYKRIIKVIFKGKDLKNVINNAEFFCRKIKKIADELKNLEVMGPAPAFIPKVRNMYKWNIIIKISNQDADICKHLSKILPDNCTIDIDPEDIL